MNAVPPYATSRGGTKVFIKYMTKLLQLSELMNNCTPLNNQNSNSLIVIFENANQMCVMRTNANTLLNWRNHNRYELKIILGLPS